MDTTDWLKGIIFREEPAAADSSPVGGLTAQPPQPLQRRLLPPHDQALRCPRCDSTHTKFCYYNNYSLSQPRYFCKTCRRYWTKGGSLRSVPVGGGCRKSKRPAGSRNKPVADQLPLLHQYNQQLTPSFFPDGGGLLSGADLHLSTLSAGLLPSPPLPLSYHQEAARSLTNFMESKYGGCTFESQEEAKFGAILAGTRGGAGQLFPGGYDMVAYAGGNNYGAFQGMSQLGFPVDGSLQGSTFDGRQDRGGGAFEEKSSGKLLAIGWDDQEERGCGGVGGGAFGGYSGGGIGVWGGVVSGHATTPTSDHLV